MDSSWNSIECIFQELKEGVSKQRSINKVQEVKQKPNEDLSKFLEVVLKAYGPYMDIDPEAPENLKMITITFIGQSGPDIQKKLQKNRGSPRHVLPLKFSTTGIKFKKEKDRR